MELSSQKINLMINLIESDNEKFDKVPILPF